MGRGGVSGKNRSWSAKGWRLLLELANSSGVNQSNSQATTQSQRVRDGERTVGT